MLSVEDALGRILALVAPVGVEEVALAEAGGRVLAADAVAGRAQPPFDCSAMDGYAVRAAEAMPGARLVVAGEAAAGRGAGPLPPGAAIRIFTGAPIPAGADAVLIQEEAARDGDAVVVQGRVAPGANIRRLGGDFPAGFRLAAPRRLGPRDIALLAAMNVPRVTVRRRPVVALVPTGDELVEPGAVPGPDQIVASNHYGLGAMVAAAGGVARLLPIARDTLPALAAVADQVAGADLLVTLGGASVGDHDLVAAGLGARGLVLEVFRIAMRPGKPLMAGRLGALPMLGLPGNPVSAMVCGELFLRPALDALLGLPAGPRRVRVARLAEAVEPNGPRAHYMRATLDWTAAGLVCRLARSQDSNLVATLAQANALAVRPPHAPAAAAGAPIEVIVLDAEMLDTKGELS